MSRRPIPLDTRDVQRKASDPAVSAWVSANAGSGKTHVLAQRVVRLLLQGVPPARILCLTFTKVAAANMSMRVFGILSKWTTLDDKSLGIAIEATGAEKPDAERLVFARRLFARTVETPGGLKIQTIHAFCEKLLHLFPFEANVAARFEVIEDMARAELLGAARRDTLERAIHDERGPLGAALRLLAAQTSTSTFDTLIDEALANQDIIARAQRLDVEEPGAYARLLGGHFGLATGDSVDSLNRAILEDGIPPREWPGLAATIAEGGANDGKLAKSLLAAHAASDEILRREIYEAVFLTQDGKPRGTGTQGIVSKKISTPYPAVLAALVAERDRICELRERRKAAAAVERTIALLAIVHQILSAYRDEKEARGLLDFSDLITLTAKLLERSAAAWVLHKLDRGIDHILVDEAQDTSPEQWGILKKIAEDFTAGEGQRNVTRTFFAVGDEKQSIFSFQGAKPSEFDEMRRFFQARTQSAGQFESIKLKRSFRASGGLLRLVDKVFSIEAHYEGLSSDKVGTVHEAWKDDLPGLLELWPLARPDARSEPRDWKLPLDVMEGSDPPVVVAKRIAQEISAWLAPDARDSVEEENGGRRRIEPGDVMILVRSRGPFFEAVIRALKEARVPVAGADRLELAAHIAVMDLIAIGRAALLPADDLNLATVLKSPLVGLDDDDLLALAPGRTGSLAAALAQARESRHIAAFAKLTRWREAAARLTPFFFYARILGAERGRHDILARLGPEAGDAVDEFLRLALEHETREAPSLVSFLAALESAGLSIKRDMEAAGSAVRVMTVHASKGLEAKIVFLADTCGLPATQHDPKLFELAAGQFGSLIAWSTSMKTEPKEITAAREAARRGAREEYRRLLYVAMTRAEERLYVAGFLGARDLKDGTWYQMIDTALAGSLEKVPARWNAEDTILRLETAPMPRLAALGPMDELPFEEPLPSWIAEPAPREVVPTRPLAPSTALAAADRIEPEPREGSAPNAGAAEAGRLVHALLQHLPSMKPEAREAAALRFLQTRARHLDETRRVQLAAQALGVLADPVLADLFGPRSRAEIGLAGRVRLADGREVEIAGQIDRLAETAEILIADFKTGRPRAAQDTPQNYLAQLALYRAAVAPLYPGRSLRVFLVWTEGPLAVEMAPLALDAALQSLGAAVAGRGIVSEAPLLDAGRARS
ncbi:MAG: addA [Hyphomicrobiales bacterium]|nr:addA [Hyphomicrobiales bacterium]